MSRLFFRDSININSSNIKNHSNNHRKFMVFSDISTLGFSKFIKAILLLRSFLALPLGYIASYCPFLIGFFDPMCSMGMKKHVS